MLLIKEMLIFFSCGKDSRNQQKDQKAEILKEIREKMAHRAHLEDSIHIIGKLLFENGKASAILSSRRDPGLPIVNDWDCLKSMVTKKTSLHVFIYLLPPSQVKCSVLSFSDHLNVHDSIDDRCACLRRIVALWFIKSIWEETHEGICYICNNGVTWAAMENACMIARNGKNLEQWIRAYMSA